MNKFLKELTDFSELDGNEFSPTDERSRSEEAMTAVLFVLVIVLMVAIYYLYQWSSVAAGVPTT